MSMIMRATLHDHAPNTYYGQWPEGKAAVCGPRIARPLPIMSSLRAPDSGPLTFRSEVSQGIARRCAGNFCVDQKEKATAR
jgi:hypothetical protein